MVYSALLPLMRTPWLPVVEWTDALANLNGLVRFAERRNLVSARVPSHFQHTLFISCMCIFSDVNLSLCTSLWHIQNWRYSSTHSLSLHTVVVSFIQWLLYPQGNIPWYPLSRRLIPWSWAGYSRVQKNLLTLLRNDTQFLDGPASNVVTIPPWLY